MNALTIVLIILTIVLLIVNITIFAINRTTKHELNFDKSKAKIMIFASKYEDEIIKEQIKMDKKYYVLDSAAGNLKTEHRNIYILAHIVEKK